MTDDPGAKDKDVAEREKDREAQRYAERSALATGKLRYSDRLQAHVEEGLRRYKGEFVQPSAEYVKRRSETLQISHEFVEKQVLIYVCGQRELRFDPIRKFDPTIYEVDPYVHRVSPKSLDHLKELAGVPNQVYAKMQKREGTGCGQGVRMRCVDMHHLPAEETIHFNRLSPQQAAAVRDLSFNLLMGYADPEIVERPPYRAVVRNMLERLVQVPTFVGKDLLVCPDETVYFNGFMVVSFDNVVVVGNGRIVLGNGTKLHAYQIKHV